MTTRVSHCHLRHDEKTQEKERTVLNPIEPSKITRGFSTRDNIVCAQSILRRREGDGPNGRSGIFEALDDGA